jgi:prepilin-type processing-associated H-X9-DG protein
MTASSPRTASRVDVFVAVVSLTVLLAMLLPAVQGARIDAELTASHDNLRKIGAGVAAHVAAHGRLPYGTFHDNTQPNGTADPRFHSFYSGFVAILPYVGEAKLFDVYDPTLAPNDETDANRDGWSNKRVTESRPKIFLSPAMPPPEAPPSPGWSSYAWSGGNNDKDRENGGNLTGGSGGWHDGAIVNAKQGPVTIASIADGTSHTFLAGDAHYCLTGMVHSDNSKEFAGKPLTGNTVWGRGHYPRGFLSTNTPPNTFASKHSNPNNADWYQQGAFGFRSVHPGGVNFVFCDGSVKFVNDKIALTVYKALGSRAGGEVLDADEF